MKPSDDLIGAPTTSCCRRNTGGAQCELVLKSGKRSRAASAILPTPEAGSATTSVDKIDLRAIDGKTGPGNQAFRFIGTAAFSGTRGELRIEASGISAIIQGDVNGDAAADLEMQPRPG